MGACIACPPSHGNYFSVAVAVDCSGLTPDAQRPKPNLGFGSTTCQRWRPSVALSLQWMLGPCRRGWPWQGLLRLGLGRTKPTSLPGWAPPRKGRP